MMRYLYVKLPSVFVGLFALALGMFIGVTTLAWFPAPRMRQERVFERRASILPQLVQIVEINSDGKSVDFGQSFNKEGDWLKETRFRIKNFSEKEIVFLELRCDFPETTASGNEMSFPIKIGRRPNVENQKSEAVSVKPGEEVTSALSGDTYEKLKKFIEHRQSILSISRVKVYVAFVIFGDGIAWNGTEYLKQDQNDPNRYINIGPVRPQ